MSESKPTAWASENTAKWAAVSEANALKKQLDQAMKRIAELEAVLAGFTEEAPINWDAASIPQSVPFDPENPIHRNQAVGNMSVGYARIYAARKLLNLPKPGVE